MKANNHDPSFNATKRFVTAFLIVIALQACSGTSLKEEIHRDPPTYAKEAAEAGLLAEISNNIKQ